MVILKTCYAILNHGNITYGNNGLMCIIRTATKTQIVAKTRIPHWNAPLGLKEAWESTNLASKFKTVSATP